MQEVKVKKLSPNARLPVYGTAFSAGADLCACLDAPVTLQAGETKLISIGISMEIPTGYAGLVFARSGLGIKKGICLSNGVGVIDSDYRGEIGVGLVNLSQESYTIQPGDRIAQLMVVPVVQPDITLTDTLDETERGTGGFGSTGR